MFFKCLITFFLFILISLKVCCQNFEVAQQISSTDNVIPEDVNIDTDGNVYVYGSFGGVADFDFSTDSTNSTSNGRSDIFLAKYDNLNKLLWVRTLGGTLNDKGIAFTFDHTGDLIITGEFFGTVDFDPNPTTSDSITSVGESDLFISKFDPAGNYVFTKTIGGIRSDNVSGIDTDSIGNLFISGSFKGFIDVDPSPMSNILSGNTVNDINGFILSLDNLGNFRWAENINKQGSSPTASDYSNDLKVNSLQDVILISSLNFNTITEIKKYTNSGVSIWSNEILNSSSQIFDITSMDIEKGSNDIIMTGNFSGSIDFDASSNTNTSTSTLSNKTDGFLLKYGNNGQFLWNKVFQIVRTNRFSSSRGFFAADIMSDTKSNIHITGSFENTIDFDPSIDSNILETIGVQDIFQASYNSSGGLISASSYGSDGTRNSGSAIKSRNNVIVNIGFFIGVIDFDPNPDSVFNLTSSNGYSGFIQKLDFCNSSFNTITETECNGYRSPNGSLVTQSGIYMDTLINSNNCDSIVSYDVTIIPVDTSVTRLGEQFISNAQNAFYQWVDCENNFSSIVGQDKRTYSPVQGGRFAVIVLENNCADTSRCYLSTVGLDENLFQANLSVSPNPTRESVKVYFEKRYNEISIIVRNSQGQIVDSFQEQNLENISVDLKGSKGLYFLEIQNNLGESAIIKVMKE